jgi:putative spermidine/putrescine transport system ATP-binding protein
MMQEREVGSMATAALPAIRLTGLTKTFGALTAVDALDLDIAQGEFFSMLGPSGSGKTTVLRLIAGFERPTAGTVELFGRDVTGSAPFDRDVNTVFQDYALFPHMSVLENVAYGLRVRGMPRGTRTALAREALESVRLAGFEGRRPSELSGGQRQRVALARATVVQPKVLLLDEPLGALDLKLREQMQVELKEIQRAIGITFIFVTHDQEEALTLSDRIAVFNDGRIEQLGTPADIYERPRSPFVASFVGTSNIFAPEESAALLRRAGTFSLRPEKIALVPDTPPGERTPLGTTEFVLAGVIAEVIYLGTSTRLFVEVEGSKRLTVLEQNVGEHGDRNGQPRDRRGERVYAHFSARDIVPLV